MMLIVNADDIQVTLYKMTSMKRPCRKTGHVTQAIRTCGISCGSGKMGHRVLKFKTLAGPHCDQRTLCWDMVTQWTQKISSAAALQLMPMGFLTVEADGARIGNFLARQQAAIDD